ncbi:DUF1015 domain-containing protein, partial [bacterium]|nr:DUF1015 domain-containing protein [bacterium]
RIYKRAANTLQQWLADEVLFQDLTVAFYLHDHYFDYLGVKRKRRGLMARVKLEPWYDNIYPHENTFPKAKSDRLQLMQACQVSFSPILVLYDDSEDKLAAVLSKATESKPIIELPGPNERHIVWAITESKLVNRISELLAPKPLFIADGHHRYETAMTYQGERFSDLSNRGQNENMLGPNGGEAFNYIMMTLVDFSDPGLLMSSIHRLVRGIEPTVLDTLKQRLENYFIVESVPITETALEHLKHNMIGKASMAVLGLESQSITLLKGRQDDSINKLMPKNHTIAYNRLSTNLFNYVVLAKVLGFTKDNGDIAYIADVVEAYQNIKEGAYQLAFLLTAPKTESIKDISFARERMPYKSTYFHPKLPTGLVMNPLF